MAEIVRPDPAVVEKHLNVLLAMDMPRQTAMKLAREKALEEEAELHGRDDAQ